MNNKKNIEPGVIVVLLMLFIVIISVVLIAHKQDKDNLKYLENRAKELLKRESIKYDHELYSLNSDNINYLIEKKDNNYNVISYGNDFTILGIHENYLYITDNEGISYYNLDKEKLEKESWLKYSEGTNSFIKEGYIYNDKIYYQFNEIADETKKGLLTLSLNAHSIDESTQIKNNISNNLYYYDKMLIYQDTLNSNILYAYNIDQEKEDILINNIIGYKIKDNKIISMSYEKENTYLLSLYNLDTKEKNDIGFIETTSYASQTLYGNADITDDIYYRKGPEIIKYNNGENITYFNEKQSIQTNGKFLGFVFLDNKNMKLLYEPEIEKYVIDGNVFDNSNISKIKVIMEDNTEIELSDYNLKRLK